MKALSAALLIATSLLLSCHKKFDEEAACAKVVGLLEESSSFTGQPQSRHYIGLGLCLQAFESDKARLTPEQYQQELTCVEKNSNLEAMTACTLAVGPAPAPEGTQL